MIFIVILVLMQQAISMNTEITQQVKINELYESAKCHIAPYLNKDLWFLMDLVFNSPLDITFNKPMRGALDIFVLGGEVDDVVT